MTVKYLNWLWSLVTPCVTAPQLCIACQEVIQPYNILVSSLRNADKLATVFAAI